MRSHGPVCLVLKNIPERDWSFAIGCQRRVVGRSHDADIVIPDRFHGVSRRHAELWTDRTGIWVRDLASKQGTNVNGVWVDHVAQAGLVVGDTIWFGGSEVHVVAAVKKLAQIIALKAGSRTASGTIAGASQRVLRRKLPDPDDEPTGDFRGKDSDSNTPGRSAARLLSQAEIDILLWLSRGYEADVELGKVLHRSPHTIHTEVNHIYHKLGLHSRSELLAWLIRCRPM